MNRNSKIAVGLFAGLAVVLLIYFSVGTRGRKFQWTENYRASSDQPYGTRFIQQILARHRSDATFTLNDKKPLHALLDTGTTWQNTDYVFIGQNIYLDNEDTNALLAFVSSGNDAFISTVYLPFDLLDNLDVFACEAELYLEMNEAPSATMYFYDDARNEAGGYTFRYRYASADRPYFWNTISSDFFCDSLQNVTRLGYVDEGKVNFVRFSYGEGSIYLHTNPLAFTNYFLADSMRAVYASGVVSYLDGKDLIWDEFSRSEFAPRNNAPEISPISYIMQQESLRYAWWLMLAGVLLYTFFAARRRQRVIPVIEEKNNTSLEFLRMISLLHLQNGNHHSMGRKKMKYFFHFIRSKYGFRSQELTARYLARLSEKSKVEEEKLKVIADEFYHLNVRADYDADRLVTLHNALFAFYTQCK